MERQSGHLDADLVLVGITDRPLMYQTPRDLERMISEEKKERQRETEGAIEVHATENTKS